MIRPVGICDQTVLAESSGVGIVPQQLIDLDLTLAKAMVWLEDGKARVSCRNRLAELYHFQCQPCGSRQLMRVQQGCYQDTLTQTVIAVRRDVWSQGKRQWPSDSPGFPCEAVIYGKVKNALTRQGINGVRVCLYLEGRRAPVLLSCVNSQGSILLYPVWEGSYLLQLSYPGYYNYFAKITVNPRREKFIKHDCLLSPSFSPKINNGRRGQAKYCNGSGNSLDNCLKTRV